MDPQRRTGTGSESVLEFLDRTAPNWRPYGSGKVALRDCILGVRDRGSTVLFPAFVPDALLEPVREVGLVPEFYAVTENLNVDRTDLKNSLTDETAAVVVVDYFGFPCPDLGWVERYCDIVGAALIEDAAHGPLSLDAEGLLLGTRAPYGVTSLPKVLDVPNGGILYPASDLNVPDSPEAGVRPHYTVSDWHYQLTEMLPTASQVPGVFRSAPASATTRYAAAKERLSRLSLLRLETTSLASIRGRRRANYRAWLCTIRKWPGVEPLFPTLDPGLCPLGMPVQTDRPLDLIEQLEGDGIEGSFPWPRLPPSARARAPGTLVDRLAVLPVDPTNTVRAIRTSSTH